MQSINPYTGELIKNYPEHKSEEVLQIISDVDYAFHQWKQTDFELRANLMRNLQLLLLSKKEELAGIMVTEMGKVKREALG